MRFSRNFFKLKIIRYCSSLDQWDEHHPGAYFQKTIEPLMLKYRVDMYLSGHVHMYERIYPVINGTVVMKGNNYVNPGAPCHVVQGTGGAFTQDDNLYPQPEW